MYELTNDAYQKVPSQWGQIPSQGWSHPSLTNPPLIPREVRFMLQWKMLWLHDKRTWTEITAQMLTNQMHAES